MLTTISTYEKLIKETTLSERKKIRVYIGMSGGVDSSVTAYLLKDKGFNVKGVYMQCWGTNDPKCRAHEDRADAIKVASFLNIPFEVWNFEEEYKSKVIEYFYSEYKKGHTPNPDILCNSEIKFKLFLEKSINEGADFIATGHYAKIISFENCKEQALNIKQEIDAKNKKTSTVTTTSSFKNESNLVIYSKDENEMTLNKKETSSHDVEGEYLKSSSDLFIASGIDMWKDQSYFLSRIETKYLSKIILPVGSYLKADYSPLRTQNHDVREIARSINLPVASKKDSTGICFLESVPVQSFLREKLSEKTGNVVNTKGEIVGKHDGAWFFTIGQRKGFNIIVYQGHPLYVLEKDVDKNIIVVGKKKDLLKSNFNIEQVNLAVSIDQNPKNLFVRIRNLGLFVPIKEVSKDKNHQYTIVTSKPLESIAPGQYAVIYWINPKSPEEKIIVGSGVICKS